LGVARRQLSKAGWISQLENDGSGAGMRLLRPIGGSRRARKLAAVAAILLLLAQSLSVAHYHPLPIQSKISASLAAGDDGVCSLCLFHFHSPTVSASSLSLTIPAAMRKVRPLAGAIELRRGFDSHLFGRAPPASV